MDPRFHALHSVKHNRFMYVHLYYWRYSKQETSEYSHMIQGFYIRIHSTNIMYTIPVPRNGNWRACSGQRQLYLEGGRLESCRIFNMKNYNVYKINKRVREGVKKKVFNWLKINQNNNCQNVVYPLILPVWGQVK